MTKTHPATTIYHGATFLALFLPNVPPADREAFRLAIEQLMFDALPAGDSIGGPVFQPDEN